MNKNIFLILGIFCALNVIGSFIGDESTKDIFWFEVNVWVYRLFNGVLAVLLFADYYVKRKNEKKPS